jgi:hypothetical protein
VPECYIGRGKLLGRVANGALAGFTRISGESEVTISFTEEYTQITDARYGRFETVNRFSNSIQATLEAQVFDLSADNLALLLKNTGAVTPAGTARTYTFPAPNRLEAVYPLDRASLTGLFVITDSLSAPLTAGLHYIVEPTMGIVEFTNITAFTGPFTATYNNAAYASQGIAQKQDIVLELLFLGINKVTGKSISATFYKAQLEIAAALKLCSKEFSSAPLKCTLLADFSHNSDDVLSHYGRMVKT